MGDMKWLLLGTLLVLPSFGCKDADSQYRDEMREMGKQHGYSDIQDEDELADRLKDDKRYKELNELEGEE